jgi:hypothetical protein
MAVIQTAVLLMGFPAGQSLNLHGDVAWYHNYFFGPFTSQAGYWRKQSDNELVFTGRVFDWAMVTDPEPNLTNRATTAQFAVSTLESDRNIDFSGFDLIVVVLGVRETYPAPPTPGGTDGGSSAVKSASRWHHAIVTRTGDRFDFMAHEMGHAAGLDHSFGSPDFTTGSDAPGGYGHPYCIMSAMAYGGIGGPHFPTPPIDNRPEYSAWGRA